MVEYASSPIKSVELQLIRVESVAHAEGVARDGEASWTIVVSSGVCVADAHRVLLCLLSFNSLCRRDQQRPRSRMFRLAGGMCVGKWRFQST